MIASFNEQLKKNSNNIFFFLFDKTGNAFEDLKSAINIYKKYLTIENEKLI